MRKAPSEMDDFIDMVKRVCADDAARVELLWLRAMERDDAESLELLQRNDPALRARMAALLAHAGIDDLESPGERRQALGRLWETRFQALGTRQA